MHVSDQPSSPNPAHEPDTVAGYPYASPPPADHQDLQNPAPAPAGPPGDRWQFEPWRPLPGLATTITVLLALQALVLVLHSGGLLLRIGAMQALLDGTGELGPVDAADVLLVLIYVVLLVLAVGTGIVWIVWQYKHAVNARILGGGSSALGHPGWAIGAWFIPLANFVLAPLQVATSAAVPRLRKPRPRVLIACWAIAFIGYTLGNRLAGAVVPPDDAPWEEWMEGFILSDVVEILANGVGIIAAILAVLVVRRCTARMEEARPQPLGG